MKTRFWILIFVVVAVIAGAASIYTLGHRTHGLIAGVYQDGVLIRTIDMTEVTEPYEFTITDGDHYNTVRVTPDSISIIDASCPDKTCILHGPLGDGAPIVCLPNRVVIRWENSDDPEYDAVIGMWRYEK